MSEVQEAIYDIFTRYNFSVNYILLAIVIIITVLMFSKKINEFLSLMITGLLIYALFLELGVLVAFVEWVGWYFMNHELTTILNNYNIQHVMIFVGAVICFIVQCIVTIIRIVKKNKYRVTL